MINARNLTKRYGAFTAVDDVSFTALPGRVTGFLGPNGAGKSTCMRMIVGLTPPTSGTAQVLGSAYQNLPNPGRHVGVMLDASAQHPGRTGREELTLGALTMGLPDSRVDELMEVVGLSKSEGKRLVRNYSLGMRQRLGIAHALLGDPSVLILDEPANGLDPAGIRWMRGLLRSFADEGGTVLLSSHLLHEVEMIAHDFIVIGRGRIVAEGSKDELMKVTGASVHSVDDAALGTALSSHGIKVTATGSGLHAEAEPAEIGRIALEARIALVHLDKTHSGGLEELFLQLTAADAREGAAA